LHSHALGPAWLRFPLGVMSRRLLVFMVCVLSIQTCATVVVALFDEKIADSPVSIIAATGLLFLLPFVAHLIALDRTFLLFAHPVVRASGFTFVSLFMTVTVWGCVGVATDLVVEFLR
jgi:hypothetical protein